MLTMPLTPDCLRALAEYGLTERAEPALLRYFPGEHITQEGQPISRLRLVLRGSAKVCASTPDGKNLILCYYVSSGLIGDVEFMTGAALASATAAAITEVDCLAMPYAALARDRRENALLLGRMAEELARKMLRSSDNYLAAALCSGEERLCFYLLRNSPRGVFQDVLTDTACSVGLSYRQLFRLLGQLCADGVLKKRPSGYEILDRPALLRRAGSLAAGERSDS